MSARTVKQGFALSFACFLAVAGVSGHAQSTAPAQQPPAKTDAALPTAQSIIDRHIEAIGGKAALKAHNSVAVKGAMNVPANGMNATLEVFAARPNKILSRTTLEGVGEISEGFDGKVAWSINPMTGPMLATGDELAQKALDADFEGALGIATRYESIKTLEKTTFEGRPVYKVALTRKIGGADDIEFYDVETGLKAGAIIERKNPMGTVSVTSSLSDYKKFGDLLHPTVMKQSASGVQFIMTFTSIEYDKVDPTVFELPPAIKALVK
jgi:zinc protease